MKNKSRNEQIMNYLFIINLKMYFHIELILKLKDHI